MEKPPTADLGKSPAQVGKETKDSKVDVTADKKKKDTNGTPPAEPPVEPPSKPDPEGHRGDPGKDGKGGSEFPCPKCGGKMAVQTVKQEKNKGRQFYGCLAWSKTQCKGSRDMDGRDTTRGN